VTGIERPLLFVDVDGVLNPYAALTCPDGYLEHHLFPGEEPVRLRTDHGPWFHELAAAFELVWGTGWNVADRRHLVELLALPEIGRGLVMTGPFHPRDKVPAIAAVAAARPLAWIDDLLEPEAWAWAAARAEPTLLVPVDPCAGLDRAHVDALLAWADALG
jgi:hypothetical protein